MKLGVIVAPVMVLVLACGGAVKAFAQAQVGDTYAQEVARGRMFPEQGGEALFKNVCQACHMPNAQGAPGVYPALAKNSKLAVAGYPISVVLDGSKAMPSFARMMSDQQIADVVTYVRTRFGNDYKDKIAPADVKALRP